jgi:opacity protein-like surface antigen
MLRRFVCVLSVAILVIIAAGVAQAQENFIGAKGGISMPKLSGGGDNELTRDYKSRMAANFGAVFEFGIRKRTGLQFEINYAGNGGKRNGVQPITQPPPGLPPLPSGMYYYADFKNEAILNYLEVPALIRYRLRDGDRIRPYLNGGIFYGYLLNATQETSGSSTIYLDKNKTPLLLPPANQPLPPISFNASTDIKDDLNHNNFGLAGGGGVEFPHKKNFVFIDLRVSYGLRSLQRDTATNGNSHTGNLLVSVGYAFKLK